MVIVKAGSRELLLHIDFDIQEVGSSVEEEVVSQGIVHILFLPPPTIRLIKLNKQEAQKSDQTTNTIVS